MYVFDLRTTIVLSLSCHVDVYITYNVWYAFEGWFSSVWSLLVISLFDCIIILSVYVSECLSIPLYMLSTYRYSASYLGDLQSTYILFAFYHRPYCRFVIKSMHYPHISSALSFQTFLFDLISSSNHTYKTYAHSALYLCVRPHHHQVQLLSFNWRKDLWTILLSVFVALMTTPRLF